MRQKPRFLITALAFLNLSLVLSVPSAGCVNPGDDDDATREIPPPEGCSYNSLANVTFALTIHYAGEDYTPDILSSLVKSWDPPALYFPFPGMVTEMGTDPETGLQAVTLTEQPPEPEGGGTGDDDDSADADDDDSADDEDDPNWVRIVYSLPLGYELPVSLGDYLGVHTIIDFTTGSLITGFSLWEIMEDGTGRLLFLAEPSEIGLAYEPGELHPAFGSVTLRDRACPNLAALQCAKPYNLSIEFETVVPGDDDDSAGAEPEPPAEPEHFELWPTEHRDFLVGDLSLRVINVWSYGYREIDPACTGYDWSADRMAYFVIRSEFAP
jgi:hypothetical protein